MTPQAAIATLIAIGCVASAAGLPAALAQERKQTVPLKEFINPVAVSTAARIMSQDHWARTNCPRHFTSNMWLSPLGDAYVAALRALDPTKFKEYLAGHIADLVAVLKDWETDTPKEVSTKRYEFCNEVWVQFLVVEDSASKAYWAGGWQPTR